MLVWPSVMVWPENLPIIAFLRTMHENESRLTPKWLHFTRRRFLIFIIICIGIYQWVPSLIMPILSSFGWLCMIDRNNVILSQLGGFTSLAMLTLNLNWRSITTPSNGLFSPIIVPRWAQINIAAGFFLVTWLIIPVVYYSNVWDFKTFPILTCGLFDTDGNYNDGSKADFRFTAGFIVLQTVFLGAVAGLIVHTICFHSRDLLMHAQMSLKKRQNDVHCRLMNSYPELPEWVYFVFFAIALIGSCLVCRFGNLMPWYFILLCVPLASIFIVAVGILRGLSGVTFVMEEFFILIGGLLFDNFAPPLRNLTFYIFTWSVLNRALGLTRSLKLAHYLKISPRTIFLVQLISTIIASFICHGVTWRITQDHPSMCDEPEWQCINTLIFNYGFLGKNSIETMIRIEIIICRSSCCVWYSINLFIELLVHLTDWYQSSACLCSTSNMAEKSNIEVCSHSFSLVYINWKFV